MHRSAASSCGNEFFQIEVHQRVAYQLGAIQKAIRNAIGKM
jgi:hypothetical protein